MPDTTGSTSNATSTSGNGSSGGTAVTSAPSTPATIKPPSNDGWQDSSSLASEADLDFSSAGPDDTLAEVLAASPDAADGDLTATDVVDGVDVMTGEDKTLADATTKAPADDFDPVKLRETRDAESAALALLDAIEAGEVEGITAEDVKSMWGTNKRLLTAMAKNLAKGKQPTASGDAATAQTAQTAADPFAPIFENATKQLSEVYGEDSAEAKAIIGTLRPIVDQIQKAITESITGVKGEYGQSVQGINNNTLRIESEFAATRLAKDFPKLDTDEGYQAAVQQMVKNVKELGKKYPNVREAMKEAAKDLWGKEKELARRQNMAQEAKVQSTAQPTLKTGRGPQTVQAKAIDQDTYENGAYAVLAQHPPGEEREKALADYKRRYVVKR